MNACFLGMTFQMQNHFDIHSSRIQPQKETVGRAGVYRSYVLGYHGSNGHGIWCLR